MHQSKKDNLDLALLLPAAILCRQAERQEKRSKPALEVKQNYQTLWLGPRGHWDAEMFLEALPKAMSVTDRNDRLEINLQKVERMDDLLLSALLVVVRGQSKCFRRISLAGLPLWANARLRRSKGDELMGPGWSVSLSSDSVGFWRGH